MNSPFCCTAKTVASITGNYQKVLQHISCSRPHSNPANVVDVAVVDDAIIVGDRVLY
jgi:hypothetical protein